MTSVSDSLTDRLPRGRGWLAPPSAARRSGRAERALVAIVVSAVAAAALLLLQTGDPNVASVPMVLVVAAYLLWTQPLRRWAFVHFFLALAYVGQRPTSATGGLWQPPFFTLTNALVANLNSVTGVSALRFSGSEALFVPMLAIAALRELRGVRLDSTGRVPGVSPLNFALGGVFVAVLAMEARGLASGGDFNQSLWQFRMLLWLPLVTLLYGYCLRGLQDFVSLAIIVVVTACLKVAVGVAYLAAVAWPTGFQPESMTGHDDSVHFVVALSILFAILAHRPTVRTLSRVALPAAIVLSGIVLNDRRTAFVSLVASLFVMFVLLRGPVKRALARCLLLALPFIAVYLMLSRTHSGGVFKPGAALMSVTKSDDASSKTRDIEDYNLIQTLKPNMVIGTGWGHEYNEVVKAYDISKFFEQYRYVAHNSVLWLLSIGGIIGLVFLWMPLPIGVFLATRSYRLARTPGERAAAASALAVLVCFALQAWSDMGTQGLAIILQLAGAYAVVGKLARLTNAWPAGVRVLGTARAVDVPGRTRGPAPLLADPGSVQQATPVHH